MQRHNGCFSSQGRGRGNIILTIGAEGREGRRSRVKPPSVAAIAAPAQAAVAEMQAVVQPSQSLFLVPHLHAQGMCLPWQSIPGVGEGTIPPPPPPPLYSTGSGTGKDWWMTYWHHL